MKKKLPKTETAAKSEKTPAELSKDKLKRNTRFVSLMTYATEACMLEVLEQRRAFLSGCRYILHDQDVWDEDGEKHKKGDPKEAHFHLCLVLERARRLADVIGWFKGCLDSKGEPANTMAEAVTSLESLEDYFTHSDEASRDEGKHQYTESDLKVLDGIPSAFDFKTSYDKTGGMSRDEKAEEENAQLIEDILGKVSFREMARRYGRDYMKNYKTYRDYCACILLEESGGNLDEALALMGDPIQQAQRDRERMARNEGQAVGERDSLLSVITYLDHRVKDGDTYLRDTLEVLRHALRYGGKL
jgi:hypothetical protein